MTQSYTRALGLALILAGALLPSVSRAVPVLPDVQAGWDLFHTSSASFSYGGLSIDFHGVPIQSYDFGSGIGVQDLKNSAGTYYIDTIVRRNAATFGTPASIVLEALSLVSDKPIAGYLGGTAGDYVKTQIVSSDPSSHITINGKVNSDGTAGGTFSSYLNFDLALLDAGTGQVLLDHYPMVLAASSGHWSSQPDPLSIIPLIDRVNVTFDPGVDFFIIGDLVHDASGAGHHNVLQTIPLPAALWLFGSALAGLGLFAKRRSSQEPA